MTASRRDFLVGAIAWVLLVIPPLRQALESTMTLQMLVQIPLLAAAGWLMAQAIPARLDAAIAQWDWSGISGIVLASFAGMAWMLPRALDATLGDPHVVWAKFLSVPLLVGVPIALSWPRAGFVVRGVLLLELIATAFRLGWLYLISPVRLCSNYLLDDQQRLGRYLLVIGFMIVAVLAYKLVWGRNDPSRAS